MQNLSLDQACFIINRAREYDVKVPPVEPDPASNPLDEGERGVIEDYEGDATGQELEAALTRLDNDEMVELVALVWIGRGDYTADDEDWNAAVASAREALDPSIVRTLMQIPLLGDHLENGLEQRGFSCDEYE
jgi:hypothetical protein